jgi:hypothetical protein
LALVLGTLPHNANLADMRADAGRKSESGGVRSCRFLSCNAAHVSWSTPEVHAGGLSPGLPLAAGPKRHLRIDRAPGRGYPGTGAILTPMLRYRGRGPQTSSSPPGHTRVGPYAAGCSQKSRSSCGFPREEIRKCSVPRLAAFLTGFPRRFHVSWLIQFSSGLEQGGLPQGAWGFRTPDVAGYFPVAEEDSLTHLAPVVASACGGAQAAWLSPAIQPQAVGDEQAPECALSGSSSDRMARRGGLGGRGRPRARPRAGRGPAPP